MRKKLCSKILALFLALNFIIPAFAAGDTVLSVPEPEMEYGVPAENLEQTSEGEQAPDDIQEPDENPDEEQTTEDSGETETPETPAEPAETEAPETPADPAAPVTPAMPEDPATPPAEVSVPASVSQPETAIIDVVVPNTGTAVINPYGLPVMLDNRETTEQITGSTMLLENHSTVAVDVSASAVGTAFGDVVFVTTPPASDAVTKELFLYAEFQAIPYPNADISWTGLFSDTPNQLLIKPYREAKDGLMRLDAAGMSYSWGAVRLFGSVAAYPDLPWQAGDGFEVNIVFTFTPVEDINPAVDLPPDAALDTVYTVSPDTSFPDTQPVTPTPDPIPESVSALGPDVLPDPIPDQTSSPDLAESPVPELNPDEKGESL